MKLFWLGDGPAALLYVPGGAVTVRAEGSEIPEHLARLILKTYSHVVTDKLTKVDMPETLKGGEN